MAFGSSLRLVLVAAACAVAMAVPGCSCAQHSTAATTQAKKLAALKELRDSGVISPEEYAEKVAALQPAAVRGVGTQAQKLASLRELHDSGVLSDDEYQAKVAALGGSQGQVRQASMSKEKGPGMPTVSHALMDQAWGLPWGTIKLPTGWGFNGGVVHAGVKGCVASGDSPMFSAESPDKRFGVSILPTLKTNWSTDPQLAGMMQRGGCPMVQAKSAAEYLTKYILPHVHGTFQIVDQGPEPMLAQGVQQMAQQDAQFDQMGAGGQFQQTHHHTDAARVLVTYQEGGITIHEVASALVGCSDTVMRGMQFINGGRPSETIECMGLVGILLHVPDDGTPFTMAAINASKPDGNSFFTMEQNPAWQRRFQQAAQQTSQQIAAEGQANLAASKATADNSMDEFRKRQAIMKDASDYSRQVHNNVYQNERAASDHAAAANAAYLGDYNVYTNPETGQQVQMSNRYTNTYINQNGNVALQTDSATDPGVNWTLMKPKY